MVRLAAVLLTLLAACGAPPVAYPVEFGENFKSACIARADATTAYCDCVWRKIETEIAVEDFIGFDAAAANGQPHPTQARIERFTQQCLASG